MARFEHPLPFGAAILPDGQVRFRLWAPGQEEVQLELEGSPPAPMKRRAEGWFDATVAARPGDAYRYRLGTGPLIADPGARAQRGDVHGPSLVVDPGSHAWRTPDWQGRPWREAVVYELHAGLCGGFAGVKSRLRDLAALGITAIELMPVAAFPGRRNWGYDGVLPFAPAACYGAPDDLKELIDSAHELGLMMMLDVVYNHFGPDGNAVHAAAPAFFRDDLPTPWGPAIDFRQPAVRGFFTQNALYWLNEFRFDGLRLDAVHAIADPGWLDEMAAIVRDETAGRHVHLVLEHDGNASSHLTRGFTAQWNDDYHHVMHVLLTGETDGYYVDYADQPAHRLARCLAQGFDYQGQPSGYRKGVPRGEPSGHLPPTAFVNFIQNHDQTGNRALGERLTTLADPQALQAALALLLLSPAIPLLFMGEEIGTTQPFLFFTDHGPDLAQAVREGRRREFAQFAAFAGIDPNTIPDPNDPDTFERSRPIPPAEPPQGYDWTSLVRYALAIRREHVEPFLDGAFSLGAAGHPPAGVTARWRLSDGSGLLVAANFGPGAVTVPSPLTGRILFELATDQAGHLQRGELPPYSFVALKESPL